MRSTTLSIAACMLLAACAGAADPLDVSGFGPDQVLPPPDESLLPTANADAVLRCPYETGQRRITAAGDTLVELPGGPLKHHWTKNSIASPDGTTL